MIDGTTNSTAAETDWDFVEGEIARVSELIGQFQEQLIDPLQLADRVTEEALTALGWRPAHPRSPRNSY
ncbi:hypothetical protein [Gordonia effusa]|uniref:hypothetical protein n=1 Tax=Gordonia effusa TaxID=263908 RepID=UPI00110FB4BC|nr:hypothetical protein [Gordonia effusa]